MRGRDASPERIREPWGQRTPYAAREAWPERVDVHLAAQTQRQVTSAQTGLEENAVQALVTP